MNGDIKRAITVALILSLAPLLGCDTPTREFAVAAAVDTEFRCVGIGCGGPTFNTNVVGYTPVSQLPAAIGASENGVTLVSASVLSPDPANLERIWVEDGQLFGLDAETEMVASGYDFMYASFLIGVEDGGSYQEYDVRIGAIGPNGGVDWNYAFYDVTGMNLDPDDSPDQGVPTCVPSENNAIEAVLYGDISVDVESGKISELPERTGVYIACASGAMGKVARDDLGWGYRKWELGVEALQTAVRAARADYCGDGQSWTVPGTEINLVDTWGINSSPSGVREALWNKGGAACMFTGNTRIPGVEVVCLEGEVVDCMELKASGEMIPEWDIRSAS